MLDSKVILKATLLKRSLLMISSKLQAIWGFLSFVLKIGNFFTQIWAVRFRLDRTSVLFLPWSPRFQDLPAD